MTERRPGDHPSLEELAALVCERAGGAVPGPLQDHLEGCVLCRLEVMRLRRFAAIDGDAGLVAAADWERAGARLDAALPTIIAGGRRSRPWARRWPAVAVLAAALALVAVGLVRSPLPPSGPGEPLRGGGGTVNQGIVPVEPVGELTARPDRFTWRCQRPLTSFTLEVFTPGLETVFRREGLGEPFLAVGDSLAGLLEPGRTYLWGVRGFSGLKAAASAESWFTLPAD